MSPLADQTKRVRNIPLPALRSASALYLLAASFVVFGLLIPELYLTGATINLVLSSQAVAGIVALAVLVPFVGGAFDLSVGAMVAFSLAIVAVLERDYDLPLILVCALALLACAGVGLISGLIVVVFKVNSFIATLGMGQVTAAAAVYLSENRQIVGVFSPVYLRAGQGNWLGIPRALYYLIAIALVVWYILEWTPVGRRLFATGYNVQAARLAGIRTDSLIVGSLIASAVIAGTAGLVLGAQVGTFSNSFGAPLLFPAFAALFFGATQFKGRPNVWGTLVAVFALAFGIQGLQLMFSGGVYWLTPFFNGAALVIAVAFAARSGRRSITPGEASSDGQPPTGEAEVPTQAESVATSSNPTPPRQNVFSTSPTAHRKTRN